LDALFLEKPVVFFPYDLEAYLIDCFLSGSELVYYIGKHATDFVYLLLGSSPSKRESDRAGR
jgi:CDP-glycerol glycerophosphotransferase (TagB/SpsB family)